MNFVVFNFTKKTHTQKLEIINRSNACENYICLPQILCNMIKLYFYFFTKCNYVVAKQ